MSKGDRRIAKFDLETLPIYQNRAEIEAPVTEAHAHPAAGAFNGFSQVRQALGFTGKVINGVLRTFSQGQPRQRFGRILNMGDGHDLIGSERDL